MSPSAVDIKKAYSIASIPADGIGPEVIEAGIEVLKTLAETLQTFELDFTHYDWSSDTYKKTGQYIPDNGLEQLKKHDAILFGAVGAPDVPDHISLWGLRLAICQPFQQYANVRPTKVLKGTQSPLRNCKAGDLDWVIIRENSEGEYAGHGGRSHRGRPWETATEVSIFTRHGVTRLMRFAFETAQKRPRKLLTIVTKSNAQRNGMVLWDEIANEVAKEFPDVTVDKMLVDAMTTRMVLKPETLDTIVATNLVSSITNCDTNTSSDNVSSTLISSPTWLRPWLAPSALRPPATWIQLGRTHPCSSPSTARLSILLARALPTLWRHSGRQPRCSRGLARRTRP
jgi:isocitrate/isopropylmalate dehydrogenase